jgi:cytochrome oxidase Cu insertion factor (SCO1/SenC/PrrC family)
MTSHIDIRHIHTMSRKIPAKSSNMMKNPLMLVVISAFAAGAFGAAMMYATGGFSGATTMRVGRPEIGGPFTLVNQDGKTVTDRDFLGKYTLVFFGYTYCPDVCPAGLQTITAALDKLGPLGDRLVPIFISVDPARDTVSQMATYVKNFHPRLVGLTGTEEQVRAAARAYRVYYAKADNGAAADAYTINHTAYAYLMGPDGHYITYFRYGISPEELTEALRKQLSSN